MRSTLCLVVIACFGLGCDASDISDNPPVGSVIDASSIDADPNAPDASDIDADPGAPDAAVNRAQAFCDRYDDLCTFDPLDANRFDDEPACLAAFNSFDAARQTCVEDELDAFENDANAMHCARATGTGPCN